MRERLQQREEGGRRGREEKGGEREEGERNGEEAGRSTVI